MRVWYIIVEDRLRPYRNMISFNNGKGELNVYSSKEAAVNAVVGDKLSSWNYPHDTFTFNTEEKENGTVVVEELDNRHSDWYKDPGIERTYYTIIPLDLPIESN